MTETVIFYTVCVMVAGIAVMIVVELADMLHD